MVAEAPPAASASRGRTPGSLLGLVAALAVCLLYCGGAIESYAERTRWQMAASQVELLPGSPDASREAVVHEPFDQHSLSMLGMALQREGKVREAQRAFDLARQLGWRDQATQIYWIRHNVAQGDLAHAALHLDVLLRQYPRLVDRHDLLELFERTLSGRAALASYMTSRSEWARLYTDDWSGLTAAGRLRRAAMLEELARRGHAVGCAGAAMAAEGLVGIEQAALARSVWRSHCPEASRGITDRNFAALGQARGGPFAWSMLSDGAVDVRSGTAGAAAGGLTISNTAYRTVAFATQLLAADPGRYRLSWGGSASAEAPVVVVLGCRPADGKWQVPAFDSVSGRWSVQLTAQVGCPSWLTLAVRPQVREAELRQMTLTPDP